MKLSELTVEDVDPERPSRPLEEIVHDVKYAWSLSQIGRYPRWVKREDLVSAALIWLTQCVNEMGENFHEKIFWAALKWRVTDHMRVQYGRSASDSYKYRLNMQMLDWDAEVEGYVLDHYKTPLTEDPARIYESREELARTIEAMNLLPPRLRYILEQSVFYNKTLYEIADDLGITESRVCQLIQKARRQLRVFCEREPV